MQISSDTNIWIDFRIIDALSLPFRLSHSIFLSTDALEDELLTPPGINKALVELGLLPLQATEGEYFAVSGFMKSYPRLSRYDALALSVAKARGYALLTGDKALRKAGIGEGVPVKGTLWIFDELQRERRITDDEYHAHMLALHHHNGKAVRLPVAEIHKRLLAKTQDLIESSPARYHDEG